MSIDSAQLDQSAAPVTLTPAAAPSTAATPDVPTWLLSQLAPIATQAAQQVAQQASQQATAGITSVVADVQAQVANLQAIADQHRAQIADAAAKAGTAVLGNIENDPVTQRMVVVSVVVALLIVGIGVIGFAALGNATCQRWIAGGPVALGAAILWVSKAGVTLPKPAAK